MLPLTEAEKITLLRLAKSAIADSVQGRRSEEIEEPSGTLQEPAGAFVTIRKGKRLRGCIGYVEALKPLHTTVRECAAAAALQDPRFEPVRPEELPALRLEVSVLSPLEEIEPGQVEVGRHGLLISQGLRRGLLLPQVAVEWNWDRERFLEETCIKAGLPPDAWRQGARVQAFTAEVFEEPGQDNRSATPAA